MDIYEYTGPGNIDRFAIWIRTQGCSAYVETDGPKTYLVTDYLVCSIDFRYIGQR